MESAILRPASPLPRLARVGLTPSLVPAAFVFARGGERRVAAFLVGHLAAWTAAGLVVYLVFEAVRALEVPVLAWDRAVATSLRA